MFQKNGAGGLASKSFARALLIASKRRPSVPVRVMEGQAEWFCVRFEPG
jgi:hypothetical protein